MNVCVSQLGDSGVSTKCLQSDTSNVSGGRVGRYEIISSILNGNIISSFGKNTEWCYSTGFSAKNLGHSLNSGPDRRSINNEIKLTSIDFIRKAL